MLFSRRDIAEHVLRVVDDIDAARLAEEIVASPDPVSLGVLFSWNRELPDAATVEGTPLYWLVDPGYGVVDDWRDLVGVAPGSFWEKHGDSASEDAAELLKSAPRFSLYGEQTPAPDLPPESADPQGA